MKMPDLENTVIRKAEPADVAAVKKIEMQGRLSPWSVEDYKKELTQNGCLFFIAEVKNETVGFVLARLIMTMESPTLFSPDNFIDIYNIGVEKKFRNRAIGSRLLAEIIKTANEKKVRNIQLEVRKSNIEALNFYLKNGFEPVGERRNFYTKPTEDALLMSFVPARQKNA